MQPVITVIIPTTCEQKRRAQLLRAIDSILTQQGVEPKVLVAVNGTRFDQALLTELRARRELQVEYLEVGSAPKACEFARSKVATAYFSFLDDDDILLPGSLLARVTPLELDHSVDLAVGNGFNELEGKRETRVNHAQDVNADPALALIDGNWLTSCGGIFRTSSIGQEFFAKPAAYNEWTLLAFRIACSRKVVFIDTPTFVIHNTPGSLSKTLAFVLSDADVIRDMISIAQREDLRFLLKKKLGRSLHYIADHLRQQGKLRLAWKYHLQSLATPEGLNFIFFTRKLFLPRPFKQQRD